MNKVISFEDNCCIGRIINESNSDELFVGLAGGPCLHSDYFVPFIKNIAIKRNATSIIIDYPNHSNIPTNKKVNISDINYPFLINEVNAFISNLNSKYRRINIVSHSLGAKISTDLSIINNINSIIMMNIPYIFQTSSIFAEFEKNITLENTDVKSNEYFIEYFKKTSPMYFTPGFNPPNILFENCKYLNNYDWLNSVSVTTNKFYKNNFLILLGEADRVCPDDNEHQLKKLFEDKNIVVVKKWSHFGFMENTDFTTNIVINYLLTK